MAKEFDKKCFSPDIIEELQKENQYSSQYQQLVASAQIEFEGKKRTLSELEPFMKASDRSMRKKATKAYWGWFEKHEEELGKIFDSLVKIRTTMAQKLGYKDYTEMGYYRMYRFDYTKEDVQTYRKQVLDTVVPVTTSLFMRQQKRLGLDALYAWDEKVEFQSGNPTPKQDARTMVEIALHMYQELDKDTGEFFQFMVDHELMDLESKPGKAAGGYCTSFDVYGAPFIFANFNQTSSDVETLTHEAGHAYQAYASRDIFPSDCIWPTSESAEIHSMSMEFLTYPWMKDFFKEDTRKFYFQHLSDAIKFLPYGVLVDHFQHEIYAHPEYTHIKRMETWRKLEKMYLPHKNYDEIAVLERGGWWMRQLHIFMDPFYYIDYTLAQVCALQFWSRAQKKDPNTLKDYKRICKLGGSLPFRKIVQAANLKSPFEEGCLNETMKEVQNALNAITDEELQ
ncbi:M3 family oligoendopeptidase [Faecalicoccus pleomorphus]|uniref:M3 family oligoendopeptidase n=1 Tax=Faecalicoccus pleomorphus TaxID=1323 RepID=UPI002943971D|nr:M3 family oligoendopeptidase [Faecalicoccus pleomorphus]